MHERGNKGSTQMSQTAQDPAEAKAQATPPIERWIGYTLGAVGAAFFATKGIVIKLAMIENVDALTTLTWRMIIAVPFFALIGWMGYRDRRRKQPGLKIAPMTLVKTAFVGMIGYYIASYLDFAGLEYITAQLDRLILLTYPFFVVLFGAIAFRRKVSAAMVAALMVSYSGLIMIFGHELQLGGTDTIIGSALVLGAAIAFALYQLLAKPLIDQLGARLFTSVAMTAAGFAVVIHFLFVHPVSALALGPNAMWLMLAMGTVSTVLPAYLISASIGIIGPEPTAIMGNVSPVITILLAVTVLGELFSVWHAIGAAMVLLGIITFTRAERRVQKLALKVPPAV